MPDVRAKVVRTAGRQGHRRGDKATQELGEVASPAIRESRTAQSLADQRKSPQRGSDTPPDRRPRVTLVLGALGIVIGTVILVVTGAEAISDC